MLHPVAWVAWLGAMLTALSITRNPLHLILVLLCIAVVNASLRADDAASVAVLSPLRFALLVIPLSALFNAATVHVGDSVLFRLPEALPLVGGPVTLEALVFGVINGLALSGIFAAFVALNRALPVRALIRLIPRAFYPVAVVISIAVTFVPTTLRQWQQIREAQAVRGHRVRGLRDWLPLFMPLLIGGLERALGLAEAMTARGFAGARPQGDTAAETGPPLAIRGLLVLGLAGLLGGWLLRSAWGLEGPGLALLLAASGLIVAALWALGRQLPRTTYRAEPWTWRDGGVLLGAALALAIFVLPGLDRAALFYYPFPALSPPDFDPRIGLATLGLLGPALLSTQRQDTRSLGKCSEPRPRGGFHARAAPETGAGSDSKDFPRELIRDRRRSDGLDF